MTESDAKKILLLYRPGTADAGDPQVAEALALAKNSPELAHWLEAHWAAQEALRAKFKQIAPPLGLKEQIISEHTAGKRAGSKQPTVLILATVVLLLFAGTLAIFWMPRSQLPSPTLADYQTNMVSVAERGYTMDVITNDLAPIRAYLTLKKSPVNFTLPTALQKTLLAGCSVEHWQNADVSMVCFRTGKPLPPGSADLWLFVMDRSSVKNAPDTATPQFVKISRLTTATWVEGDKLYLLGVEGDKADLEQYL